mmetsp:Transcript_109417/g.320277  ORF Transcript_109417/g.320277 Transcript_109417/m.320277 type:complete len:295 (+) Transcript_109417:72-956(+)
MWPPLHARCTHRRAVGLQPGSRHSLKTMSNTATLVRPVRVRRRRVAGAPARRPVLPPVVAPQHRHRHLGLEEHHGPCREHHRGPPEHHRRRGVHHCPRRYGRRQGHREGGARGRRHQEGRHGHLRGHGRLHRPCRGGGAPRHVRARARHGRLHAGLHRGRHCAGHPQPLGWGRRPVAPVGHAWGWGSHARADVRLREGVRWRSGPGGQRPRRRHHVDGPARRGRACCLGPRDSFGQAIHQIRGRGNGGTHGVRFGASSIQQGIQLCVKFTDIYLTRLLARLLVENSIELCVQGR